MQANYFKKQEARGYSGVCVNLIGHFWLAANGQLRNWREPVTPYTSSHQRRSKHGHTGSSGHGSTHNGQLRSNRDGHRAPKKPRLLTVSGKHTYRKP
jgi:hypothetical protein